MTELTVSINSVSLPANTSGTLTVYEDQTGDGAADYSDSVALVDGQTEYTLAGFEASFGNNTWPEVQLDNSDITQTGRVSEPIGITINPEAPVITGTLTFSASGDSITLDLPSVNWNGQVGDWKIARSESPISGSPSPYDTVSGSNSTYTDDGLEDGERFYYAVYATNDVGTSGWSNETDGVTDVPNPTLTALDASTQRTITLSLSVEDNSPDGDVLIERSDDDGATWSSVATVTDLSATSYTDTDLLDGEEYTYRLTRRTDHAEATSGTLAATTILPTPSAPTHPTVGAGSAEYAWDATHNTGDTRVEYRPTDESAWQTGATVDHATESTTVDGLRNGEAYDSRVVASTEDAESASATGAFETDLPDEDQPVVGNGVEDEIAVDRESAVSDYGDVRIQVRETGQSAWDSSATGWAEQVIPHDQLTTQVTGREDGERYEVRLRTETEHVTGEWTAPVAITTKFPGAQNLTVTSVGETTVAMEWDDVSDNEDGTRVERREQFRTGFGDWRVVDDLPSTSGDSQTVQHTDDSALPDTSYEYRVVPYTEHTSAASNVVQVTTADTGVTTSRVPATGPYVEVDLPDGQTLTPDVSALDWSPTVNERPSVEITVPQHDRWSDLTGQPMRVWDDGVQLPIDRLDGATDNIGSGTATTTLEGSGGQALDAYVDDVQIDQQETHLAARDVIDQYTPYGRNVDDPATDTRSDVTMLTTNGSDISGDLASPPGPTDPWAVTQLDGAAQLQTGWFREVEDEDFTGGQFFADVEGNPGAWSGGEAVQFDGAGDGVQVTVFADHEIPQGEFVLEFLRATPNGNPPFDISFDETVVDSSPVDVLESGSDEFDLQWGVSWTLNPNGPVEPGFHSVELSCTGSGSGSYWADALHVRDDRESYTFDSDPVDGVVDGPEEYPATTEVVLDDVTSVEQVIAGEFEVAMSSTAGAQALAISNDGGSNWIEAANSDTVSGQFQSATNQLRARVTLSRYASDPTTSPAQGDAGQSVDELVLRADLEDTPVTFDAQYRADVGDILADLADDARAAWELRRDPAAAADDPEGYVIEWTQIGQRTRASTAAVTSLETRETIETAYDRVIVFGRSKSRQAVEWSVSETDSLTGLGDGWIVPDSERVYDPDSEEVFERGEDYRMDWQLGAVAILEGGSMSTGTPYAADFEFKYRGEATTPGVDEGEARTIERQIPGATSDRECDQLALSILKDVQEAQLEATLTLLEPDPDVPLLEALSHPRLPDGTHEIRGIERSSTSEREYRLANRRAVGEIVDDLEEDFEALANAF